MDRPADHFNRAASTPGTPCRPLSAFGCLPPRGGGQGEPGRDFHLVRGPLFLLQHETLGHFLTEQGLLPRKPPSHLFSEDSLVAAEVGEGSKTRSPPASPRGGGGSLGRPEDMSRPALRAESSRAGLLRYVHWHLDSSSEPQFPPRLADALSPPPADEGRASSL